MARSKEFDVDNVLGKAMNVFWQQGYEKTSMQDLVAGMGIHKRSMYDTFGDKHSLYIKSMERFAEMTASRMEGRVEGVDSAKEAIRRLFDMIIHKQDTDPAGCLLVNSAVELANHDPETISRVNDAFLDAERLLEQLVTRGQASGEIAEHHRAADLAVFLHNALVGLRVMVKINPDRSKLQRIVDTTLAVLD